MTNGLPSGLQGWVMADQANQQRQLGELQQVQGLMQLKGLLAKQQQEQAFRSEIAQATTPEEQIAVATKYMGPDALARVQQGSLDRKATLQAANVNATAQRDQRMQELTIRGQQRAEEIEQRAREGRISQAQAAADRAALQQNMARLAASLRQPQQPQPLVSIVGPDGKPTLVTRENAVGATPWSGGGNVIDKPAYNAGLREVQKDETSLANVTQMENALKRWSELNANVSTGRVAGLRPAVGQPQYQELVQLQNYLAVNNFKPGQGQISNFERQLIKGAGPSVSNDAETNQRIVDIQLGAVQNARDRAEFRERYLDKHKKLLGADKEWNEYIEKNPRFTKGEDGAIIPNPKRKEWTDHFSSLLDDAAPSYSGPDRRTPDAPPPGAVRRKN